VTLSPAMWARIHANQSAEIALLIDDRTAARRLSLTPPYACIGRWLEADRGGKVIELGCGPGRFVAILAQLGYQVTGVDPCTAESLPTWARLSSLDGVALKSGVYAERLPFADGEFDHAACLGALLYFDDPAASLRELHRVLKPGGRLVLRTVNSENFYTTVTGRPLDPASKNLYTRESLVKAIEQAGFDVHEAFSYGFWPPVATQYWWYLVNTWVKPRAQQWASALTPARRRVNITVMATRRET
jgi:ubiquinone/menaquinone biosynthesis C-methylase UbiE